MSETLVWWLMMQVVGLAALPLCLLLFRRLPDRGYTLSKAFALILVGYWFWILNVMHILPNSSAGIWLVLLAFLAISAAVFWWRREELIAFFREHWSLIVAAEVIFFLAFITAAYLRSYVADIGGTEKPMDFMFLNAVTEGKHFPPPDPWLAGKSISYYYFGYLLVSVMTRLSALQTSVGFNLGLSMIVALSVIGIFGLVYNLAAPREQRLAEGGPGTPAGGYPSRVLWRPIIFGVIAAFLLLVIGNVEGLLEALAAHGVGSAGFWKWAHIDPGDLVTAYDSKKWYPDHFWFWWRSTRILDNGVGIHEFPFFSFLLGDLHPHVMSMPFVLLALGVAQTFLRSDEPLDVVAWLERPFALIAFAIIIGGLGFLNTWDMPTMIFVVTIVALLRNRLLAKEWSWGLALDTAGFVLPLFLFAALAYVPFFLGGFTSQASGFAAEPNTGTGLFHLLLLWGPFAIIVLPYAVWRLRENEKPVTLEAVAWVLAPAAVLLALWFIWDLLGANRSAGDISIVHSGFGIDSLFGWFPKTILPVDGRQVIMDRISNRGWNWLTAFVMAGSVGLLLLALWREVEDGARSIEERLPHIFALTLATTASLLILGAEFFYIKDTFDSRMNTIFKLYYQSWIMLAVASGFALYELARAWSTNREPAAQPASRASAIERWQPGEVIVIACTVVGAIIGIVLGRDAFTRIIGIIVGGGVFFALSGAAVLLWRANDPAEEGASSTTASGPMSWRMVWAGAVLAVLAAAFVYPVLATYNRTNGFNGPRTLDGMATYSDDQQQAIKWLADLEGHPVIAEATGDDYTDGGRFSASTGLPSIIQWVGHELQWRGSVEGLDPRKADVETLYTSQTPEDVQAVLQKYNVSYVIVSSAERNKYPGLSVDQMDGLLSEAFQQGDVTIYRVQPGILSQAHGSTQ